MERKLEAGVSASSVQVNIFYSIIITLKSALNFRGFLSSQEFYGIWCVRIQIYLGENLKLLPYSQETWEYVPSRTYKSKQIHLYILYTTSILVSGTKKLGLAHAGYSTICYQSGSILSASFLGDFLP